MKKEFYLKEGVTRLKLKSESKKVKRCGVRPTWGKVVPHLHPPKFEALLATSLNTLSMPRLDTNFVRG